MVRLRGFKKLLNVDEALEKFINESKPTLLGRESILINEAYGRVLASDVKAEFDIPPSNRSTMDGYAIRSRDVIGASVYSPKRLKVVDEEPIKDLEAKRVWTGNPIPKGSDAVIELERTRPLDGEIEVLSQVTPGRNVSMKGESIRRGEVAVKAGSRLKPHHLGLLASLGLTQVDVARKPRVAILSTGDELVKLGEKTSEGKTIDSNKLILSSMCSELGAEPVDCGIARDDFSEISSRIDWGVKNADIVITSGGTSVGEHDLVPLVIEGFEEGRILVHGVAMRPGVPTALGLIRDKPIIALSGNPVAAIAGFEIFARPMILAMLGSSGEARPRLKAKLTRNVPSTLGFRVFLRVKVTFQSGDFFADPVRTRGSSILTSMTNSNGYVLIPENREGLFAEEEVIVHLFDTVVP